MYLRWPGSVQQVQRGTDRGRGDIAAGRGHRQPGDEEEEEEEKEEAELPCPGCTPVKPKPTHTMALRLQPREDPKGPPLLQ
ncbi:hypothetical protein llap_17172 [Limosa lapponica baueri]|uniref:Uncharacterized protein n=1 Tax=Limosa lapponica baueri TaxID=1758121 RepID=A0A2I0TFE3_LIMLA|nr:hypothetical protein llap_17172 [Limosa lapponica baueri]